MTQERVKCPFCSELILPDAIKCRFCGEWISRDEAITEDSSQRGDYGGRQLWGSHESNLMEDKSPQEHAIPTQNVKEQIKRAKEANDGREDEHQEAVNESRVRVVSYTHGEDKLKSKLKTKRYRVPWLRIILVVGYLGIAAALGVSEFKADRALRDAKVKESSEDYRGAFNGYRDILDAFPFSFAAIETNEGLRRLSDSHEEFAMPRAPWILRVEDKLGEFSVSDVYLLPFVAWPACAVLLCLVALTRIFRPATALLSLLFMVVAGAGSVAQFSWYGLIPLAPVAEAAQKIMQIPVSVYCASYGLLLLTVLMTLTAASRRTSRGKN